MKIETDLKRIEQLAEENEDENWAFRSFLKQLDLGRKDLDAIVHRINDEVSAQIDCTACGNCCKQIRPVLDMADVSAFADGLNIPVSEIQVNHLELHPERPSHYYFNALPCPFLSDNRCTNYDHRPQDCRSYPHLHKDDFLFRLMGVIGNYAVCPIVFNVYERLKEELWDDQEW
jgi:hypothetical protein